MKPELIMHDKKVVDNMDRLRTKTPHASMISMQTATQMLRGYIVKNKLSGQVLKRVTGDLARKIDTEVITEKDYVIGRVGSNLKYARVHELGIDKMVTVKQHQRQSLGGMVTVREHMMHMKQKKRQYIGSSLKEMRPRLQKILGQKFWTEVTSR